MSSYPRTTCSADDTVWMEILQFIDQLENHTRCDFPFFCPEGSPRPIACDLGYGPVALDGLRFDKDLACSICNAGTFRSNFTQIECLPCVPGYFCPEGTSDLSDNICTEGHECPSGGIPTFVSSFENECSENSDGITCCTYHDTKEICFDRNRPIPCIPGTFSYGQGNHKCLQCAAGTYNNDVKMSSCLNCGSSSISESGATTCDCIGDNRVFQQSDSACVCGFGYEYSADGSSDDSEGNSENACIAIQAERCDARSSVTQECDTVCQDGQIWLAEERLCVRDSNNTVGTVGYEEPTVIYDEISESIEIQVGAEFVTIDTEDIFNFDTTMTKVRLLNLSIFDEKKFEKKLSRNF